MQGPKWPLFYSHIDLVWSLLIIGTGCTLSRAPCIKETLPDFREWCRVTRYPRVFRGLTGCQRDPRDRGVTVTNILQATMSSHFDRNGNLSPIHQKLGVGLGCYFIGSKKSGQI